MKQVVSRNGDGSKEEHYTVHSPLLPMDINEKQAAREWFPDYEEFLLDEDGRFMANNLRDVTVRTVRLGKITYKEDLEPDPAYTKVSLIHHKTGELVENVHFDGIYQAGGKTSVLVDLGEDDASGLDLRFWSITSIEHFDGKHKDLTFFTGDDGDQDAAFDMCVDLETKLRHSDT
jgi:hypothetical protein